MDKNKLKPLEELLDSVRDIDGFPIGTDEDILNLSDPPYYTACPNPYISDFIEEYGKSYNAETDDYERKPFVGDVSEGKSEAIYNAHTYHTKVPPKAIEHYIKHYTNEGDLILDGFCGSGMTGVASQRMNRKAILSDISPIASFISYNYNKPINASKFEEQAIEILNKIESELGWLYYTRHTSEIEENSKLFNNNKDNLGIINYVVWSDYLVCPFCKNEYVFFDLAVSDGKVLKEYICNHCEAKITKRKSEKSFFKTFDSILNKNIKQIKQKPVLINYSYMGKKYDKIPDTYDLEIIEKVEKSEIPFWVPDDRIIEGDESRRNDRIGLTNLHHFYTKRNLWILSAIKEKCKTSELLLWFTSQLINLAKFNRYRPNVSFPYNPMSGTFYISSQVSEANVFIAYKNKIKKIKKAFEQTKDRNYVSVNSITNLKIKKNSIDYIFTDPPFGANLMYSELSFIWESWLKIKTNNKKEAIINKTQQKDLYSYRDLMTGAMKEYYRVLKPNRWITVEFHNSKASVWSAIQEAITKAGFIIAQVAVLDKKQGSFKQVTSPGAVSKDLVINAYKPKEEFKERFLKTAGEGMEVEFIKQQLNHLPIEPNIERTEQMLYSKMLAHYIEQGFKIKYNSQNFFELLEENFAEIDGYWFDDVEVNQYNEWKSKQGNLDKVKNLSSGMSVLFITDEKSALQWIYNFLSEPKNYSEIFTAYQKVSIASKDYIPELKELLENNFFTSEGKYRRPDTRQERKKLRKNREKELERAWKKFSEKAKKEKRKIKNVRREALMFGFKKCYDEEKYTEILFVAEKLHASIYEEDSNIMDFIDAAKLKSEDNKEGTLF